ncbi:unnamed protein product [Chondrus crispus]|uniref:Uncharacterized protein n=1 Tax=Chondrus crispus TaxID=2769 RepID=R7QCE8_CHOCR|nr:unnamed protein product [Chondrus crispus]CDF36182.1 unnamed protein product [Chondrus crispus]|eukprot:XP_005716001.1 unnamed protein product [Chondrus crispus]
MITLSCSWNIPCGCYLAHFATHNMSAFPLLFLVVLRLVSASTSPGVSLLSERPINAEVPTAQFLIADRLNDLYPNFNTRGGDDVKLNLNHVYNYIDGTKTEPSTHFASSAKSHPNQHGKEGGAIQFESNGKLKNKHPSNVQKKPPRTSVSSTSSGGPTKCSTQRRVCGSTCRGGTNKRSSCVVQVGVPKICQKDVKIWFACAESNPKMCTYVEKEPSVCTRAKTRRVQCPDEKYSCDRKITEKVKCHGKSSECERWSSLPCKERTRNSENNLCRVPSDQCHECKGNFVYVKCRRRKWFRTAVPCPLNRTPSPAPSNLNTNSSPNEPPRNSLQYSHGKNSHKKNSSGVAGSSSPVFLPFPDKGAQVASIRCFASFFDEFHCKDTPSDCHPTDKSKFDAEKCTGHACAACSKLDQIQTSPKLKVWCQAFSTRYCEAEAATPGSLRQASSVLGEHLSGLPNDSSDNWYEDNVIPMRVSEVSGRCFKDESKMVYTVCEKKMPGHQVCVKGCRLKKNCKKQELSKLYKGYCKHYLPRYCDNKQKKACTRTRLVKQTCSKPGKKTCNGKVTESYVCWKPKTVKKPCKQQACRGIFQCAKQRFFKKCSSISTKKYVCGMKEEKQAASCTQSTGSNCTPKYCTVRSCTSSAH